MLDQWIVPSRLLRMIFEPPFDLREANIEVDLAKAVA